MQIVMFCFYLASNVLLLQLFSNIIRHDQNEIIDNDDHNERTRDDGSDDIRGGPHLHDCPLCKQSVKSADHKHSSLQAKVISLFIITTNFEISQIEKVLTSGH